MGRNNVLVDAVGGVAMLGGNKKIYIRLLQTYESSTLYQDAVQAVMEGELEKAQIALHTLKGTTGNLHLDALFEASKEIEVGLKLNKVMPSPEAMADLAEIQCETINYIKQIIANPDLLG